MAVVFSFAYLAAIYIAGTLGSFHFEDLYKLDTAGNTEKVFPWERELWLHRNDPRWSQRYLRYIFEHHNQRQLPSTVKARGKTALFPKWADQTWGKERDTGRRPQILREPGYSYGIDGGPLHPGKVYPNGQRRTVALARDEFSANDLWLLMQNNSGSNGGKAQTVLKENSGNAVKGVEVNGNGTSEKDVKGEGGSTTAEDNDITVSSVVEETSMPSDLDKVDDVTHDRISESRSSSQATTVTVEETASTVPSTTDLNEMSPSTSSETVSSTTSTVEDTTSPSMNTFPSSEVTAGETVSPTPSTASDSSSEGTSPSKTRLPSSTVTARDTFSTTPSTAGDSSSKGTTPSKTLSSSSLVTASETVSPTPSTASQSSSKGTSSSKTPLQSSTVPVSETASPTPSTVGESSSSTGGASTLTAGPDHVIVLPRIRAARIVLSSVLLAIGLVAVAVAAVCIFRERRRKLKYDQLKLLP